MFMQSISLESAGGFASSPRAHENEKREAKSEEKKQKNRCRLSVVIFLAENIEGRINHNYNNNTSLMR
jgi:hypothetical protein